VRTAVTGMWISLEGINGVGKTYLASRIARRLGCHLVSEVTDGTDELTGQVITALASGGTFLRTGHPITETLALIALKVRAYEKYRSVRGLIIEDRGIDTVAVYQSIILGEAADRIYQTVARWRPLPDRTVLLVDDLDVCIRRYERRTGSSLLEPDRALVVAAAQRYDELAALEPGRFVVIDRRGRDEVEVLAELHHTCRTES
jgi:dTMP kinase